MKTVFLKVCVWCVCVVCVCVFVCVCVHRIKPRKQSDLVFYLADIPNNIKATSLFYKEYNLSCYWAVLLATGFT